MAKNYCYVVTKADEGWDCVVGVYLATSYEEVESTLTKSYGMDLDEDAAKTWLDDNHYIIHQTLLKEI